MSAIAPLQFGVPGGLELLVLVLMLVFYAVPILVVVLLFYYLRRIDRNVQELLDRRRE